VECLRSFARARVCPSSDVPADFSQAGRRAALRRRERVSGGPKIVV
jgi:hypothetical protein